MHGSAPRKLFLTGKMQVEAISKHQMTILNCFAAFLLAAALNFSTASPIQPRQATVDILSTELPGINWGYALSEFTVPQLAHLRRAFTYLYDLSHYSDPPPPGDDLSFLAYFGRGYDGVSIIL
jgi:hypothetical protein